MAKKKYSKLELIDIAEGLLVSLKPKGLTIGELRQVFEAATRLVEQVVYGQRPEADESGE